MVSEETDRILNEIGQLLAQDSVYPLDGTLLYAQVEAGMVSIAIFKNRDNSIVYRWPDLDHLGDALFDLWYAEDSESRWAEVEYLVRGDRFEVRYVYANEIDLKESDLARRDKIVERYFGNKPIVYPPLSEADSVPIYDL